MLDDDRATQPLQGTQLLSYALGELDAEAQSAVKQRLDKEPGLQAELAAIHAHLKLHRDIRKVAPRRGSFERLQQRMRSENVADGAIPGVHCLLRRSFVVALVFGVIAVGLMVAFSTPQRGLATPDVIGQIVYTNPALESTFRRDEVERSELVLMRDYSTGAYDAYLWLPTGVANTYSSLETAQNTDFVFTAARRVSVSRGELRRVQIQPGGLGEGPFIIQTPHATVQADEANYSVGIARDGSETRISVLTGSVRVFGADSDRAFVVGAGQCMLVERGRLPNPAMPMLELRLARRAGADTVIEATMVNRGFVPIKIRRPIDRERAFQDAIYVLHVAHASEFTPGLLPENTTLPPMPVTPDSDPTQDHSGELWLEPDSTYSFTFDISTLLVSTPPVEHWLRLEYRGDLYGPPGYARVRVQSEYLKLDRRGR
jgi:anti-sigma-K factor RskA